MKPVSSPRIHRALVSVLSAVGIAGLAGTLTAETVVVINEFKADPPGADTGEFLELFAYDAETGLGVPGAALDGYVVVFFNGGPSGNPAYAVTPVGGAPTVALRLDGRTTNAAGFFVIGSPAVAGSDIVLSPGGSGWLQNGPDGVGLYRHPATDFTTGTGATGADLVDAIVYGTDDPDDPDLLEVLTPGGLQIHEAPNSGLAGARLPDGGPAFMPGSFAPQAPTPGSLNQPTDTLAITLAPPTLREGATREALVTRSGNRDAAVSLQVASSDPEAVAVPATVAFPPGAASASLVLAGVDDLWPDGTQSVEITVTAPGYQPARLAVTVTDDGDVPQPLVINEVFASGNGDANQDGAHTTGQDRFNDEFVEIVNRGEAAVDLSGYQVFSSAIVSARHTFPAGTVLPPGGALVLFGGGTPALGITEAFGTAWIQVANAPTLGLYLPEPASTVSLRTPAGQEVAGFRYDHPAAAVDSITRSPDAEGSRTPHATLGDGSIFHSPGTRTDGRPFVALTARLTARVTPSPVAENAGRSAATLTVQRPAPFTHPLVVTVLSHDATEAVPAAATLTIAPGRDEASVAIDTVDDTAPDGPQDVTFTCTAAGHLNGMATLVVADDGLDSPPPGVFINEIDTDQPGADTAEFVELYVGEPAARSLDGYLVVFFNGNHAANGAYLVVDLTGRSSDANGFFVIGSAAVPEVDLVLPNASIQNGADAVAVYRAPASAFVTGSRATPPTLDGLIDVVVYGNASAEDTDLLAAFRGSADPSAPALVQESEGQTNNADALARRPDAAGGFGRFIAQPPTPGALNSLDSPPPPAITLHSEGDSLVLTFTGILQESSSLVEASFAPVPGATSPHRIPRPAAGTRFFRAVAR